MYLIRTDSQALDQVEALTDDALTSNAQVLGVLELVPWNGEPHNEDNPKAAMRQLVFGPKGQGIVVYLILDDQRLVDVLQVVWVDW